jgi:hypothetical protein
LPKNEVGVAGSSWIHGKEAWHDVRGVMTSAGGEATLIKKKGGNDVSWADANLIVPNNKENSYD